MNQFPPAPEYYQGRFKFFQKVLEQFAAQGAPPVSLTPVKNRKNHKSLIILL
jgi:hypothetical protein